MSRPTAAMIACAAVTPTAGDLIQFGHRRGERGDLLIDPGLHDVDVGGDAVDAGQHGAQQERVVIGEPPGERLLQPPGLGPQISYRWTFRAAAA